MTVKRQHQQTIVLDGACGVEDAEPLLQMLLELPGSAVDWRPCKSLHTAVFQILFIVRPRLIGPCGDTWVETWLIGETPQAIPVGA